ncbi:MAG: hypothetical protein KDK90_26310 [Leptospiraceae bacterium]|nr:hypothetical protein [Leptospiraceae bacterium]
MELQKKWAFLIPFYGFYTIYKSEINEKWKWYIGQILISIFIINGISALIPKKEIDFVGFDDVENIVLSENITISGRAKSKREIKINGDAVTWDNNKFFLKLPLKIGKNKFTAKYKTDNKDRTFNIIIKRVATQRELEKEKKIEEKRKKESNLQAKMNKMSISEKDVFDHLTKKNKNIDKYELKECNNVKKIPLCSGLYPSDDKANRYLVECNNKYYIHEPLISFGKDGFYIIELENNEADEYLGGKCGGFIHMTFEQKKVTKYHYK